jgi:hypothetical protein
MAASSNQHPELPYYSTLNDDIGVKPYVFRVKGFIEMINQVVEGLIDNKIEDDHHFKRKEPLLFYVYPPHRNIGRRLVFSSLLCCV